MNIGEYSVVKKLITWLVVIVLVGGGVWGFEGMGKLEDPAFTIKKAKVITAYPGASAQQVQDEVTFHIEDAIQRLEQVKRIKMSISRPGLSDIEIEFKDKYQTEDFPDIYDELRRKLSDMQGKLPPGAGPPEVVDDFADVYGVYLALTGEGYSPRELHDYALTLKKQLALVNGVRKVTIEGVRQEMVYVDLSRSKLAELGIPLDAINQVLQSQNLVSDAGKFRVGSNSVRIQPTGEFTSVKSIGDVLISSQDKRLVYLKDIATISREYQEIPEKLFFVDGRPALTLGISMQKGMNVIAVGQALTERLDELVSVTPVGMQIEAIYNQSAEVDKSITGFIDNVIDALIIVIVVLFLFMGPASGFIIGSVLLVTVAGTLFFMHMFGIELQRVSLGAMVIALGMLVDNAIVVCEGMLIAIKKGIPARKAAGEVVRKNLMPLLGGTVIGILAFSAIGLSQSDTGEFARSLFYVLLISLMLSWLTAITTTPMLCDLLIKPNKAKDQDKDNAGQDAYDGGIFRVYKRLVALAMRYRLVVLPVVVGLFVLALFGFGQVKQAFFPNANTPIFFVDVWKPEGTDIRVTQEQALSISAFLRKQPGVVQTTTVVGGGHQRFSLVYEPKEDSPVYAQIIVQTEERDQIPAVWDAVERHMAMHYPDVDPLLKSLRVGPGRDGKIEARFHGPDQTVLRELAEQAQAIMRADVGAKEIRTDWREAAPLIAPQFNEQLGRQLGITREDLAHAMQFAHLGSDVGIYRDGIRLLPIRLRAPAEERGDVRNLQDVQVWSPVLEKAVPVTQVVSGYETVWEENALRGRNRIQTIIVSSNPVGELADPLFNRLRPEIEQMPLPPGYSLSWGGEYEDAFEAQDALFKAIPAGFLLMALTTVLLFGTVRQPLIIWLTVPMAIVGITAGLLLFDGAFDFMSLLGGLSLIGLLIKNAIVLIEEIDGQIAEGKAPHQAILDASASRLRPVMLAACTTILGMIPLLGDVFFVNMSLTIMCGLGFATLLTLIVIPVLYSIFFRVKPV